MKNRNRICEKWWVVAMMAMAVPALADSGVGLFKTQFNSVTTSSTLQWTNLKKEAMANYVVGADSEQGRIYLCRARHDGDMLLGQLRPEYTTCAVSGTKTYETFEVLENIENASLIIWKPWVKFDSKPNGAVVVDLAVDSVLIGRKKAESGFTYNIGRISYGSNIGHLNTFDDKNNELTADNGDILIEIEPVSYKLQNVVLDENTLHSRQTDPVIFQEFLLENKEEAAATVTMEVEYKFNYTVSWGHGHGISTGLDTDIEMADGSVFPRIRWANPFKEERKELFKLEKYLLPGTACNVTFRGNYTDRDVQYTAKLLTSYKDNLSRSREIHGERIENTVEVEAIYGEIFFTANNTLVPTTTTTTTSTTTSTTPLPPQTIPPSPEENNNIASEIKKPDHPEEVDNNMLGDSSEVPAKTPIIKEDIKTASVGGLGSKPNNANTRVFVLSLLMISPLFALLL